MGKDMLINKGLLVLSTSMICIVFANQIEQQPLYQYRDYSLVPLTENPFINKISNFGNHFNHNSYLRYDQWSITDTTGINALSLGFSIKRRFTVSYISGHTIKHEELLSDSVKKHIDETNSLHITFKPLATRRFYIFSSFTSCSNDVGDYNLVSFGGFLQSTEKLVLYSYVTAPTYNKNLEHVGLLPNINSAFGVAADLHSTTSLGILINHTEEMFSKWRYSLQLSPINFVNNQYGDIFHFLINYEDKSLFLINRQSVPPKFIGSIAVNFQVRQVILNLNAGYDINNSNLDVITFTIRYGGKL